MGAGQSSVQESLNDKNYDGSDFVVDTQLKNGPLFNRRCTDIFCLLIFWVFLGHYGYTCAYAYSNSNPDKLLRPVNGDGDLCGVGDLKEYPNLYYIIRKKDMAPRAVCVNKCPKEIDDKFTCHGTQRVKATDCSDKSFYNAYGTIRVLKRFCLPNPEKLPLGFDDDIFDNIIGSFGLDDIQEIAEDIVEGQYVFYITFGTCVLLTVIYAFLIYSLTGLLVWTSVIGTGVGILSLAYMLQRHNRKNKGKKNRLHAQGTPAAAPVTQSGGGAAHHANNQPAAHHRLLASHDSPVNANPGDKTAKQIEVVVYVLYGLGIAFFVALCCLWKNLSVAIAVLKTSAVIVMRNTRMLFMPFLSSLIVVFWMISWISMFILLVSTGKVTQPTLGSQYKDIEFSQEQKYFMYIQVFAFFWVMELILALFQYAIIVGTCTWYFTSNQDTKGTFSLGQGFMWGIRYNQGSLAFGAFILAVVWVIRIIFEFIDRQMDKVKEENALARCLSCCTRCCLDCFHRFIKFVNENAYIQVALTGESFCTSAMQAFILALKNTASFFITNGIGAFIFFLGKMTISIVNTAIGYCLITYIPDFEEDIDQPLPFLLLIFMMSYIMATTFMELYGGVSLAILQCLYADVDIANQEGKDAMDNSNRPEEMNYVIGLLSRPKLG